MGLFRKLLGAGGSAPIENGVRGTAQVVSSSAYRGRGVWQSCRLQLVVQADGIPATAVEMQTLAHNQRWPMAGMTLPVTIDPDNHQNVRRRRRHLRRLARRRGAAPAAPPSEPDDRFSKLERLARLHESGALTDAAFEAEKQKVLESSPLHLDV